MQTAVPVSKNASVQTAQEKISKLKEARAAVLTKQHPPTTTTLSGSTTSNSSSSSSSSSSEVTTITPSEVQQVKSRAQLAVAQAAEVRAKIATMKKQRVEAWEAAQAKAKAAKQNSARPVHVVPGSVPAIVSSSSSTTPVTATVPAVVR